MDRQIDRSIVIDGEQVKYIYMNGEGIGERECVQGNEKLTHFNENAREEKRPKTVKHSYSQCSGV